MGVPQIYTKSTNILYLLTTGQRIQPTRFGGHNSLHQGLSEVYTRKQIYGTRISIIADCRADPSHSRLCNTSGCWGIWNYIFFFCHPYKSIKRPKSHSLLPLHVTDEWLPLAVSSLSTRVCPGGPWSGQDSTQRTREPQVYMKSSKRLFNLTSQRIEPRRFGGSHLPSSGIKCWQLLGIYWTPAWIIPPNVEASQIRFPWPAIPTDT